MADASEDKILKILIDIGLKDDAAKVATAQIVGLKKEVGDTADTTKLFGVHMDTLNEGLHKSEERMEGVGGQSREMYRIFADLDRLVPGLGEGLRAMFTGPLGAIGLFIFGLYEAKQAFDEYDKALEQILGEDLTQGLDKANLLATAYSGIADAVTKANDAFNSYEQVSERELKNVSATLQFTKQLIDAEKKLAEQRIQEAQASGQITAEEAAAKKAALEGQSEKAITQAEEKATQAELNQKNIDAANAKTAAEAAAKKASAFKLPATDEQVDAEVDALKKQIDTLQKTADASKAAVEAERDVVTTITQSPFGGLLLSLFTHPLITLGGPFTKGESLVKPSTAKADEAAVNAAEREQAALELANKKRDEARKDAEDKAAAAKKAEDEAAWQNNPNNPGSLAAKLRQERSLAAIGDVGTGESIVNRDIARIKQDLATHGPGAQNAIRDAASALQEAVRVLASLSALGDDVRRFRQQLDTLKMQLSQGGYPHQQ